MYSKTKSVAIRGVDILAVTVEADVSEGMPIFDMVGLLSSEVKEAKERVRTAIKNSGFNMPPKRITINLSPAELRKEGASFDLPIAVGILMSLGVIKPVIDIEETIFAGELGLDGTVRGVKGVLPMVMTAAEYGMKRVVLPCDNLEEASMARNIEIIGVKSLKEMILMLNGQMNMEKQECMVDEYYKSQINNIKKSVDFREINGQEGLKRAALVAAAGMHNVLFIGPPGSGKTMVAERIGSILPRPDVEECIEITKIHSIAGELNGRSLIFERPFRSPHHTITGRALIGGGISVKPGEITLAHKGVLFLDELAEFKRETLDVLRQPLEQKNVKISRATKNVAFPADVMLVAATNERCFVSIQVNDRVRVKVA